MFVLPFLLGSVALDVSCVCLFFEQRASRAMGGGFRERMADIVVFTAMRLVFLMLFAAIFYRERRMSLRFPLLWEGVNIILIMAKMVAFLAYGAPFREAWLLLALCACSIALELVCVAHLRSSAGTLPRQHVHLHSAVGAMATMNLTKHPSDMPSSRGVEGRGSADTAASIQTGVGQGEGESSLLDVEEKGDMRYARQNSFDERRQFLSNWGAKVDKARETWASKVDELAGRLVAARQTLHRRSGDGAQGGGGGGGIGVFTSEGEGAPLLLLARMFAQEQAAIEELEEMWNRDPKWTEFFLPQFALFLLYASFVHSSRLEELLLARCASSVHVAHTLYWFLKAFCVQGAGVTPVGVKAIEQMLHEVVTRGERPALSFSERAWADSGESESFLDGFDKLRRRKSNRQLGGCFGEAPEFIDELVKISADLAHLPKEERTQELRRRLREVQTNFLPSRAIYLPVGRKHHVYRIAIEESFCFSTKDRAPYLVTLEVLDCRKHGVHPGSSALAGTAQSDSAIDHILGNGPPSDGGDGDRSPAAAGARSRGSLIAMLTPKSLSQALGDMKAGVDRTLTTLKRGGTGGVAETEEHPGTRLVPAGNSIPHGMSLPTENAAASAMEEGASLPRTGYEALADGSSDDRQGDEAKEPGEIRSASGRAATNSTARPPQSPASGDVGNGRPVAAGNEAKIETTDFRSDASGGLRVISVSDRTATREEQSVSLQSPDGGGSSERFEGKEAEEEAGEEEDEERNRLSRLVPPSFSSTNLMGMWSMPSKPNQGTNDMHSAADGLNSPMLPYVNGLSSDDPTVARASSVRNSTTERRTGDVVEQGTHSTEQQNAGRVEAVQVAPLDKSVSGEDVRATSAGAGIGSAGSAGSAGDDSNGVEALLLSRGSSAGSSQRAGYGSASEAARVLPVLPALPGGEGRRSWPCPSPGRRRRRAPAGGYAELRSSDASSATGNRGSYNFFEDDVGDEDEDDDDVNDEDGDGDAGSAPPTVIFKERWRQKAARLKRASRLGHWREWRLTPIIVKAGDDLRQEQLASQFFALAHRILRQSPIASRAGLRPYEIVATSPDAGIIEAIPDTVSLDALKKNDPLYTNLTDFFLRHFGDRTSEGFRRARRYFVESLAANCIVTYLLQVKDRHNGNILLDARGRVIHIDFGFMLANSPGGNLNFESAPFKLTAEFVALMDGPSSACFKGFREVCVQTFMTLRRKMPRLILLLETSSVGNGHLPCFGGKPEAVVQELRARFKPEVHDRAATVHVNALIDQSMGCWRTSWYDWYQKYTVGIAA